METISIHHKINSRSNTHRFYRDVRILGVRAFRCLYNNVADCRLKYGDHGGGTWEVPTHKIWDEKEKHLAPRYLDPSEL